MKNSEPISVAAANAMSSLALAHVGDAVYELLVRSMLASRGPAAVHDLHRQTVAYVRAEAQAQMAQMEAIINSMTPAERHDPDILNGSRRARIARGAGVQVQPALRLRSVLARQIGVVRAAERDAASGRAGHPPAGNVV